jgi:hypothetical protein
MTILALALHILSAIVWVGGMFAIYMCLRRALSVLAGCPHGCTVANMLAHGFTNATLNGLVREGLATIEPGTVHTGTRRITIVWVAITDVGRATITV